MEENKKRTEDELIERKEADSIAEDVLLEVGLKKEELLELSQNLITLRAEVDAAQKLLNELQEENEQLASANAEIREKAKRQSEQIIKDAKEEAKIILEEAEGKAKERERQSKEDSSIILQQANVVLNENKTVIRDQLKKISDREAMLVEKEKKLLEQEAIITEKEQNAALGFAQQFEEEKNNNKKEIAKLKESIEELKRKRIEEIDKIEKELDIYKTKKYKELEDSLREKREQLESDIEENCQREKDLDAREDALKDEKELLEQEKQALIKKREYLKEYEATINGHVNKLVDEKYQELLYELQAKKEALNSLMEKYQKALRERDDMAIKVGQARVSNVEALEAQIEYFKAELTKAQKEVERYKNQILDDGMSKSSIEEYKAKALEYDRLQSRYNTVCKQLEALKIELAKRNNDSELLALQVGYNAQLKETAEELTKELERKKVVTRIERLDAITRELPSMKELDVLPSFKVEGDVFTKETAWLDYIKKQAELSGFIFSQRLLNAYHTSVKIGEWSPLVVLAGVSGTGKSALPQQYALHGGMNFLSVPVKPDWDSPQSLFGYYNSIENKFEPTELLRALYQMQPSKNKEKGNQMLMVLLDEMNLAHVELYFSDLLSKFETKRGNNTAVQYEISLGAGAESEWLSIGDNVLWTGTMNEDETTKALSDKVIDRSTLITFPRPKKLIGRTKAANQKTKYVLEKSLWKSWVDGALPIEAIDKTKMDDMQETIERINAKMSELGRNLGHRVWQSIQNYIINHPDVINCKDESKKNEFVQRAFSEAIAFKIMPKLRGVETSGEYEDIIEDIGKIIQEKVPELINDYVRARSLPSKIFMWHSAEFLEN